MPDELKISAGRCLLDFMRTRHLDEYGSVILASEVRHVIGVETPEIGTRRQFETAALTELQAVGYVRNALLGEGKYLAQVDGDYRILLPSENARQIENYMSHADNKLRRAQRLSKNTPRIDAAPNDNIAARLHLKREAIKTKITMGKCEASS
jgi:hypothetical protein